MALKKYQQEVFDTMLANQINEPNKTFDGEEKLKEDLGFDSLDSIEFIMEVELKFEISIPDEKAMEVKTVSQARDLLDELIN